MTGVLLALVIAGAFLGIGRWGRHNAPDLVPATFSASARQARERSVRRGARTCLVVGGLFLAFAVLEAVDLLVARH